MSDFLAEMEARRVRASRPTAPVGAVVGGFIVAFLAAVVVGAVCSSSAAALLAGEGTAGAHYLKLGGLALAVIVALGGLLYVAFLRPRRPKWTLPVLGGLAAMVLLIAFAMSAAGGRTTFLSQQERIAATEIEKVLTAIQSGGLDADLADTRPKARGEAGEVERVTKESLAEIWRIAKTYQRDMESLGLEELEPRMLARADLGEVIARLDKAAALTVAYRKSTHEVMNSLPDRFAGADLSAATRAQGLKGIKGSLDRSMQRLDAMLDLQDEVIALQRAQIQYLRTHRKGWVVENGGIAFYEPSVMHGFNARAGEIARVLAEIDSAQKGNISRLEDYRETLKRYQ